VGLVRESGYSYKEIAELMGVSQAAVTRYMKGEIAPSPASACRLVERVDQSTRSYILASLAAELWGLVRRLIPLLDKEDAAALLETIADQVAELMAKTGL